MGSTFWKLLEELFPANDCLGYKSTNYDLEDNGRQNQRYILEASGSIIFVETTAKHFTTPLACHVT